MGGFVSPVKPVRLLKDGTPIQFEQRGHRILLKNLPPTPPDTLAGITVLQLEFDGRPNSIRQLFPAASRRGGLRGRSKDLREFSMVQTSKEVVDGLLRNTSYERVALMESFWADTYALWVKQGYPTRTVFREVGETHQRLEDGMGEDVEAPGEFVEPVAAWEHFGFDMVGMGGWFDILPLRDFDELVEETDEWEVRRNGAGAAFKYWKHKSGTPEHMDFRMTSREVWERDYRPHLLDTIPPAHRPQAGPQELRGCVAAEPVWTHYGHMFIWEIMRQSLGDISLYESLLLDPDWIHDYQPGLHRLLQDVTSKYLIEARRACRTASGCTKIWAITNGLFASPKVFADLIFPYYREMVEFFHGYNLPVVLHSCGSTAQALPLIVEAGFDALNPMERKSKNNDPLAFARKYGDKLAFVGGLDVRVLETNDKDVIRREVAAYIDEMKASGARLVFASDHSIPPTINYDSYRYALDVYREHMWY